MSDCVSSLSEALAATELQFAHFLWANAPSGDWGVYAEDGAETMFADGRNIESRLTGSVDFFTHSDGSVARSTIEAALATTNLVWWLESIQFESETGFVHLEWRWHE